MQWTAGTFGLTQQLAGRLLPLTLAIGVLLSAGIPATYYIIDARSLEDTATIYAEELAERLGELVFNAPTLWKYQAQKYLQLLHQFVGRKELISIQILDETGRPISTYTHITSKAEVWRNRDAPRDTAPIRFNNRQGGQVEIQVARDALLRTTVALLIGATVIGVVLAWLVYRVPVRVVGAMEADLARAYSGLQQVNTQLTAEIAERRRVEVALKVHMDQLERSNRELQDFAYTILMADDDADNRLMAQEAFEEARLANPLHFVEDGEALLDYLYRRGRYAMRSPGQEPGLILLDLNMPKKDGRQTLQEIKADPALRHIPIVVLTTSKAEEDILRTYDLGVSCFITKPVTFEGLVELMKTLARYWFEIVTLPPQRSEA